MQVLRHILQELTDYLEISLMYMDNLNIVGFRATIDSIDETLKQMNNPKDLLQKAAAEKHPDFL